MIIPKNTIISTNDGHYICMTNKETYSTDFVDSLNYTCWYDGKDWSPEDIANSDLFWVAYDHTKRRLKANEEKIKVKAKKEKLA